MSSIIPLGIFEKVAITQAWPTEDRNFTPWLAQSPNMVQLGVTLGLEMEVEAVEHWVGPFRADVLARVQDEADHRVLIENQFGRTDHRHLGQILTYLAGIESAKTIVWIAETFQPDHRAAIDWLNEHTDEDFSFFAVELELWRIGDSPPAPRFNVIASPNDWTRQARVATRNVGEVALAERHHVRLAYWASFGEFLKARNTGFRIKRANKDHWFEFPIGRSGFVISSTISTDKQRIGVELYIANDPSKRAFKALLDQKDAAELEFGEELSWQELPGKKACRIALFRSATDPSDETSREGQHAWMLEKMERFRAVFSSRVKGLKLDAGADPFEDIDGVVA
ncbi:DUF4268 domain-containing protein [Methylobacterium sp. WL19]|uniref:DUF4268 domain-containing protein n=1 Tax=Methylobacterium sp. WL19 TaxID=2603896 RepID=UPI0011C87E74|nr:DUF4268 domain-containing protein [Methylobacterium sp. WL19]TXN29109.1 DUF4268 domain-containing protein [Methylobacterium sp. WL19]